MKNSFLIILFFVFTGLNAWAQEFQMDSIKHIDLGTVDLGFGIVKERTKTTASTATVTSEELQQRAAITLNDALYGRLLGLTALKGGGWVGDGGYGTYYNVRGLQTLSERNILILIDGFERPINELSLDEVESVTLLKDAAATALYGYRGINGILDVKTKRGPKSGMIVNAKYNHKFTFNPLIPDFVDAYTYAQALNEAHSNDGKSLPYSQHALDAFQNNTYPFLFPNVNWKEETLRNVGSEDIVSLSVANGSQRMRYFTMLNYTNSRGLFKGTEDNKAVSGYSTQLKYSKANVRANLDIDVTSSTFLTLNLMGIISESNRPSSIDAWSLFDALYRLPSAAFPVRTEDGMWGGNDDFGAINPVARIKETGFRRDYASTLLADFKLKQDLDFLIEGLSVSGRIGYDNQSRVYENRNREFQYGFYPYSFDANGVIDINETPETRGNPSNHLTFGRGSTSNYFRSLNFVVSADYVRRYDEHNVMASVIYTQNQFVQPARFNSFNRENIATYLHYNFSGKYLADVVLMYSGSNRSYPVKWAFSPTASLGWVISKEDFLQDNSVIDFLKLRVSAGKIHTDYVPRTGIWLTDYVWSYRYWWMSSGGFGPSVSGTRLDYLPTSKFKLESANKYNVGIDVLLLQSLSFTLEGYYQRRQNILMSESGVYSSVLGLAPAYINKGIVDSKGIEIGANYDKKFGDFRMNIGGMFTYGVNKVVDIAEEPKAYPHLELKGQPVNQPRGLEVIGFFKDDEDIRNSPTQMFSVVQPGDVKYKKQTDDAAINENDFVPIGYSTEVPEINYAFTLGFEWKGIGINALFQGASNFTKWYMPGANTPLLNRNNIAVEYYESRWIPGEDNTNAKYPRLSSELVPNNNQNSEILLRNASFFKLRHCEIYYRTQPINVFSDRYIREVKVSVRGENLFTSSGFDKNVDPENPYAGYPILKGISVGLSMTF